MVSTSTPVCDFGWLAPDFALPGVDGRTHTLASTRGPKGLLVMFICNHCPYVKAVIQRIVRDTRELASHGIGSVAIMSNDMSAYPQDGWEPMREWSRELAFPFPYVADETQSVGRAYDAQCTPEFFGFNAQLELQYHGRLDASRKEAAPDDARRELFEAMVQVARSGKGPGEQIASIGCSIKWKDSGA
ncbi:MAG TPA: thioredoxin family protein [Rhodocyclaceae bacterium]|nr:thioredoxin family protein [Rhodocyclaceae bacterium]